MNQESEREFSSIFVFKIKNRSNNTCTTSQPDFNELSNSLMDKAFKFEPENYQSGFAKPVVFDRKKILLIPYYEILEEQVTEDITDKEKVGEVIPQTKTVYVQSLKYVIDANIYAKEELILVCRVDTIGSTYLRSISNFFVIVVLLANNDASFVLLATAAAAFFYTCFLIEATDACAI